MCIYHYITSIGYISCQLQLLSVTTLIVVSFFFRVHVLLFCAIVNVCLSVLLPAFGLCMYFYKSTGVAPASSKSQIRPLSWRHDIREEIMQENVREKTSLPAAQYVYPWRTQGEKDA